MNLCKKWSLGCVTLTGTLTCTVFPCKDYCGPPVLALPVSEGTDRQTEWQAQRASLLVCTLARQRWFHAWGTLWANTYTSVEHCNVDRLKEQRVKKGSGRHFTFRCRERSAFNHTNIGFISRAVWGRFEGDGFECVWPIQVLRYRLQMKLKF